MAILTPNNSINPFKLKLCCLYQGLNENKINWDAFAYEDIAQYSYFILLTLWYLQKHYNGNWSIYRFTIEIQ